MPSVLLSRRSWLRLSSAASAAALCSAGCEQRGADQRGETKQASSVNLRVLVVDDAPLGEAIQKEWHSRTEREVTIAAVGRATLADASRLPGDVIIFSSSLLGELVERSLVRPLGETTLTSEEVAAQDVFPLARREEITWGEKTYALPLSVPQLVLAYRPDWLERLKMKPPATWEEYQAAAARLADRSLLGDNAPADDQSWRGTAEPTGGGFGGALLLARAAAYASHREQRTPLFATPGCEPLIDQPPFVRALRELAACSPASAGPPLTTPADAMAEFVAGRCPMAILWPGSQPLESPMPPIRFAEVPGSAAVYNFQSSQWEERRAEEDGHVPLLGLAGRLAAVTSGTPHISAAEGLVGWLSGAEVSSRIGPVLGGAGLFRASHRQFLSQWVGSLSAEGAGQYFDVVQTTLSHARAMSTVRLPGSDRYLAALDDAVKRSTVEGQDPEQSLRQAADAWRTITADLGAKNQHAALSRSIGVPID